MSEIHIQNLTRDYGLGKGIFDISIQVEKGEVFGFLGPNGAGKTTTIRHLMGFIKPKTGSCQIDGQDCWKNRETIQKKLGYIPGEISFFDDMTGTGFLKFLSEVSNQNDVPTHLIIFLRKYSLILNSYSAMCAIRVINCSRRYFS